MPGPTLIGRQVTLRPLELADATALNRLHRDSRAVRYLPPRVRRENARDWAKRVLKEQRRIGGCPFVIIENGSGAVVGQIRLFGRSPLERDAEIGYWLQRAWWGRGFATEAIRLICRHGFRTLGLHRITARVVVGNVGSSRALTKAGFREEGRLRKAARSSRAWEDVLVYGLLRGENRSG